MPTAYFKTTLPNRVEKIQSVPYSKLETFLSEHSDVYVGVEKPSDSNMQHYLYQKQKDGMRRYPLRNLNGKFSCLKGYNLCKVTGRLSTPEQIDKAPDLPNNSLFFSQDDLPEVERLTTIERNEMLKPAQKTPVFEDANLTSAQQTFLYEQPVLPGRTFQTALNEILTHTSFSFEEKTNILRACISTQRIPLSGEAGVLAQALQAHFLTVGPLVNYPLDPLKYLSQDAATPPNLGDIQAYYVHCINEHLQVPVSDSELKLLHAEILLGELEQTTVPAAPYRGLTEEEDLFFQALNALLMTPGNSQTKLKALIKANPNFISVLDDLEAMISDLKDKVDNINQLLQSHNMK